ncbi:hypothetical protein [Idiomarina piscisalsi]|uniref:Uncharacterized protein n=1 Tax=Idiomarina piscisalsi TaxID=1096243 RepID=A0A432YFD9_9GAMM|nr:hypothetical protein [Idiomarina piscisalsi]RUO59615.1 hypothetical protein CWI73_12235 [Idiomarina piscisalsi]
MNFDLLWPRLERKSGDSSTEKDLDLIKEADPGDFVDVALDEARRLYDHEQQRRSSADSKGGLYLGVATAFLASLITLSPLVINIIGESESALQSALSWLMLLTMSISAIVAFRCILWAKRALKVTSFRAISWKDLFEVGDEKFELTLFRNTLRCLRRNYDATNEKVTHVKMAEALLKSAWFWLILSLVVKLFYYLIDGSSSDSETIIFVISNSLQAA